MLVIGQTWEAEISHEPGQKFTFRKLNARELEQAADVRKKAIFADMRAMGSDMIAELQKLQQIPQNVDRDVYDRATLLHKSIIAWTYPAEVTQENIDALDVETEEWAIGQIIEAHKSKSDSQKKGGSSSSTKR